MGAWNQAQSVAGTSDKFKSDYERSNLGFRGKRDCASAGQAFKRALVAEPGIP